MKNASAILLFGLLGAIFCAPVSYAMEEQIPSLISLDRVKLNIKAFKNAVASFVNCTLPTGRGCTAAEYAQAKVWVTGTAKIMIAAIVAYLAYKKGLPAAKRRVKQKFEKEIKSVKKEIKKKAEEKIEKIIKPFKKMGKATVEAVTESLEDLGKTTAEFISGTLEERKSRARQKETEEWEQQYQEMQEEAYASQPEEEEEVMEVFSFPSWKGIKEWWQGSQVNE